MEGLLSLDWIATLGVVMIVIGLISAAAGIICSLLPVLPGPPLSALAPLLVQGGVYALKLPTATWTWVLMIGALAIGLVVTIIDAVAPLLGKRLGRTSRASMVGSYYGLGIALLFSLQLGGCSTAHSLATVGLSVVAGTLGGAVLLLFGPLAGGMVGELSTMDSRQAEGRPIPTVGQILERAARAGLAQAVGLLLTTAAKLVYGAVAAAVAIALLVVGLVS